MMNPLKIIRHNRSPWVVLLLFAVAGLFSPCNGLANISNTPLPENYRYAKHLYDAGQFRQAAEAFEKFVFEAPDSPQTPQALYLAARAYQQIGDTAAALNASDRALKLKSGDLTASIYLLKSDIFTAMNITDQAQITLHNLMAVTDDQVILNKALYRLAWLEIEAGRFDKAQAWLGKMTIENEYAVAELQNQLGQTDTIPAKNPRLAGLLSILPGAGQLYTGRYQDAAVAFILNGLFLWGSIEAFDEDQTALGLLLGGIGVNFYVGNLYSAINGVHKFNRNAQNRFIGQLKDAFIQTGISHHKGSQSAYMALNIPF